MREKHSMSAIKRDTSHTFTPKNLGDGAKIAFRFDC
jgi:hypothetical protein